MENPVGSSADHPLTNNPNSETWWVRHYTVVMLCINRENEAGKDEFGLKVINDEAFTAALNINMLP